jgi:hypothetical protein
MTSPKSKEGPMDKFNRAWIIENGCQIVQQYQGNITLRGLHYRLVALGMTNSIQHYKRVIAAMTDARWDGLIRFDEIMDRDRETVGKTEAEPTDPHEHADTAFEQMQLWAKSYKKNRWENQPVYLEVFIEKKALQGVFERPCFQHHVALNPCKGYPSLTFLFDAFQRFKYWENYDKQLIILYFGDHDPSGDDIPRSIVTNLSRMGVEVELDRIALNKDQVIEWGLPPAPTKVDDSRSRNWDGLGQVELDSVEPTKIAQLCTNAIDKYFDEDLFDQLLKTEDREKKTFHDLIVEKLRKHEII